MAHVIAASGVLLFHLLAFAACVYCRRSLRTACDYLFLDHVEQIPEGVVDLQALRRLWSAPGDGMSLDVSFDSEGGIRERLFRADAK